MHSEIGVTMQTGNAHAGPKHVCKRRLRSGPRLLVGVPLCMYVQGNLVVNYDLPTNRESYIHRIGGRSRRYGQKGVVINFLTNNDMPYMKDIENFYNTTVLELPMNIADLI